VRDGEKLLFAGHITSVPLPWLLVSKLPLYGKVIAARMMLYFWLAAAAATALWLTDATPWRLILFALVCVTLIPSSPTRRDYSPVGKARLVNDPALLARTVPAGSGTRRRSSTATPPCWSSRPPSMDGT